MNKRSEYVLADDVSTDTRVKQPAAPGEPEEVPTAASEGEPTTEEVLRVVFGIGVGEREAYLALAERGRGSAGDLAEVLDRDRSNVNRYLNHLAEKGLVTRRRRILQSGGHVYQYKARPPKQVRARLLAALQEWIDGAHDRVDDLVAEATLEPDRATAGSAGASG